VTDVAARVAFAGVLGLIASSSLNLGALLGLSIRPSRMLTAAVMAFGAGALIEALAIELAYEGVVFLTHETGMSGGQAFVYVALGFVGGGLVYFGADRLLENSGGALRKPANTRRYLARVRHQFHDVLHRVHLDHLPHLVRHGPERAHHVEHGTLAPIVAASHGGSAPTAIFLGAVLDGIPSSIVIGSDFRMLSSFDPTFLIAVCIANFPQAMSSASGMRAAGLSRRRIHGMWLSLTLASGLAAALGNAVLVGGAPVFVTIAEAVGGGATLAMLASTMMPEAFEDGGPMVSLLTIAGFLAAFVFTAVKIS
jgi:zinc transporter, ZIP family